MIDTLANKKSPYTIGCYYFPGWKTNAGQTLSQIWPAQFVYPWAQFNPTYNAGLGDFYTRIPLKGVSGLSYDQGGPIIEDPIAGVPYVGQPGIISNGGYGGYPEDAQWVMDQSIIEASNYGIDFFVFDHYWEGASHAASAGRAVGSRMNHALQNFITSPYKNRMQFAVLCTNSAGFGWPDTWDNWQSLMDYYITLFADPSYHKIDGIPVVYIFDTDYLQTQASVIGGLRGITTSTNTMLEEGRTRARAAGFKGIHFIACQTNLQYWLAAAPFETNGALHNMGYDGCTAYNYSFAYLPPYDGSTKTNSAHSFITPLTLPDRSIDQVYQTQWDYALSHSKFHIDVPVTSGWDHRPWGASGDPLYDNCQPTDASEFQQHLQNAKDFCDKNPWRTKRRIMLYAWNEHGEGGQIEPTRKYGFSFLQAIKDTFLK